MSKEYLGAVVLLVGAVLKIFKIEIDNGAIEGLLAGLIAVYIAYRRWSKGDITVLGSRKY
jgi:hypothetical protein